MCLIRFLNESKIFIFSKILSNMYCTTFFISIIFPKHIVLNFMIVQIKSPQRCSIFSPVHRACRPRPRVTVDKINLPQQNKQLTPTRPAKAGKKLAPPCHCQIRSTLALARFVQRPRRVGNRILGSLSGHRGSSEE